MTDAFQQPPEFGEDPPCLFGSHDTVRGETYFPPRKLAVDGSLRELEAVTLSGTGTLHAFTSFAGILYGQIDLPEQVRLLTTLAPGDPQIGATYHLEIIPATDEKPVGWRFRHA